MKKTLENLVISGDISSEASEDEYKMAFDMLDSIVKRFGLDADHVIIVPGNHDLNWDDSEDAYQFVPKRKLTKPLSEGKHIPAGELGAFSLNESLYKKRFVNFSSHFYKRIYGHEYPLDYEKQAILIKRPEDQILFLMLNSCWQIDHHFKDGAGLNMDALHHALDHLQHESHKGWLKIAVWHHPVTGRWMMNDEFMQLLAVHGFQVCMHGHIHEAVEGYHKYDNNRGIHIIGAGTFGAPAEEQVRGIPLQYNLLTFDPKRREITINTRKKEKADGAWSADARWSNKKDPKSWYSFEVG